MHVPAVFVIFGVTGLIWLLVFPVLGSSRKDKWGINFHRVPCPGCGAPLPMLRVPTSAEEARAGGWTCQHCHTRSDKWGRKIGEADGRKASG